MQPNRRHEGFGPFNFMILFIIIKLFKGLLLVLFTYSMSYYEIKQNKLIFD